MSHNKISFCKNIQLFLLDGTPNGRLICELSNWTGIAYKIPRTYVLASESRKELFAPGVYFLFGKDEAKGRPMIYIGEAEDVFTRLKQHLSAKDNWHEVIAFISKDKNLNKAHIKYLENYFYSLALNCNRYSIDNANTPSKSSVSEAVQAELEEFVYNAKILVNTLGHKVFEPLIETSNNETQTFYLSVGEGEATGAPTSDGFVLFKGSSIQERSSNSMPIGAKRSREECRESKRIIDNVLQDDMLFSSSSSAAAFATGNSVSGPQRWKTKDGESLKSIEEDIKK